jgi:LmbE family N-acetylglucosaminyl deacetylase
MVCRDERLLVVSPHFDDAVFSCGELLAWHPNAVVVTVFAGLPGDSAGLTEWDGKCGFMSAQEAMLCRAKEDAAALTMLGAGFVRLDFPDAQYGSTPSIELLCAALLRTLLADRVTNIIMPLGLFHSDHRLVHEAALEVAKKFPQWHWFAYEDALYRAMAGQVQQRLSKLQTQAVTATPRVWPEQKSAAAKQFTARKHAAVQAYASQLKAFGPSGYDDVFMAERYWRLSWLNQATV